MSADMNKPIISSPKPQVAMNADTFRLVFKKAISSWIETVTKEVKSEEMPLTVDEIQANKNKTLMQSAVTQRILNDADPKSRATFNIVI